MTTRELKEYTVRPLLWEELPLANPIRKDVGFVLGTHQLETLWKVDPGSIYGAITENGELYGICAIPFVGTDMAYLSLLVVIAEFRKLGIGKRLMEAAMDHVGTHNVYLHCLTDQANFFRKKFDFKISIRELKSLGPGVPSTSKLQLSVPGVQVVELSKELLPLVVKYDEFVFGTSRKNFVELALSEQDAKSAVACRGPSRVCGYGFLTADLHGRTLIRSVLADTDAIAEAVLSTLLRESPYSNTCTILVQMKNSEEMYFEKKLGLNEATNMKTLFRWPIRNADLTKVYATS